MPSTTSSPPPAVDNLGTALREMKSDTSGQSHGDDDLKNRMAGLETAANKWLKPYPNAGIRENVEVLLVALAVAMGIRTFFVQPFKIPTGSMQPTLFGVTTTNLRDRPDIKIPGTPLRVWDALVHGRFYHEAIAEADGVVVGITPAGHVAKFITKTTLFVRYNGRGMPTPPSPFGSPPTSTSITRAGIGQGSPFTRAMPS